MERSGPLRPPIASPSADALPGGDAGRDSARHYAAVGIFSFAGLAVLGLAAGVWLSRGAGVPETEDALFSFDPAFATSGVAADTPVLRPSFGAAGSIVVFDGATGQNEVMSAPSGIDAADTAFLAGTGERAPLMR